MVLKSLLLSPFEPLELADFRALTKKVLFLVALATAKKVGEIQALSRHVADLAGSMLLIWPALWLRPSLHPTLFLDISFLSLSKNMLGIYSTKHYFNL